MLRASVPDQHGGVSQLALPASFSNISINVETVNYKFNRNVQKTTCLSNAARALWMRPATTSVCVY